MISMNACIEPTAYKWKIVNSLVYLESQDENYILNEIGSRLWKMFDGYTNFETIVKRTMEEEGEEDMEEVRSILSEYIEGLASKGFVAVTEDNFEEDW